MTKYDNLRLREPDLTPTDEVLKNILGGSFSVYKTFQEKLSGLELEQDWQYYGCSCKSWMARGQYKWTTPRGTSKEKTIYWLSVWDGCFKVVIWFLEKNRGEVQKANISDKTRQIIAEAKTLGKMMTFPVEFEIIDIEPLADICTLINCKKNLESK